MYNRVIVHFGEKDMTTTAVIVFQTEKPSDEVRTVRVVIDDVPDLHLGDTFALTTFSRFRHLKVAERHWEGTPRWLHITCFVEASTVANMITELDAKQMSGYGDDYILPNQPWY